MRSVPSTDQVKSGIAKTIQTCPEVHTWMMELLLPPAFAKASWDAGNQALAVEANLRLLFLQKQ